MLINVAALIGQLCITVEDGEAIHAQIMTALDASQPVTIDFKGSAVFASPFFNAMVGTLLDRFSPEELNARLKFQNLSPEGMDLLRRVIKNSREYFSDPKVRKRMNELAESSGEHRLG